MFSHIINNPNNFVIKNNDYFVIPFGHRCASALACKIANIRKFSLPFDWTCPSLPDKIQQVLENNFDDYIPDVYNGQFSNKYGFSLVHFNKNIKIGIEEYERRINRFNDIMNQPTKKYFIYINEDYLYDKNFRTDEFNDNLFNNMLKLENFIKDKYINIDYNILFFNFKNYNIPKNSNILNIVLNTSKLYYRQNSVAPHQLRDYCGKILRELFNTKLSLGYDNNIFKN
jgi:hypothetical protein